MSGVWKRKHGGASEAPTAERVGKQIGSTYTTAPHLDSTMWKFGQSDLGSALLEGSLGVLELVFRNPREII